MARNSQCAALDFSQGDFDVTTGKAFTLGPRLRQFTLKQGWSQPELFRFMLAMAEAEFGDFRMALKHLQSLAASAAKHPISRKTQQIIEGFNKRQKVHPRALKSVDDAVFQSFLDYLDGQDAARAFLRIEQVQREFSTVDRLLADAAYQRSIGDYENAVANLNAARAVTGNISDRFARSNPKVSRTSNPTGDLQWAIDSDIVETQALNQRAQDRKIPKAERRKRDRNIRQQKAALRAAELAIALVDQVPSALAIGLLEDAHARLGDLEDQQRLGLHNTVGELMAHVKAGKPFTTGGVGIFDDRDDTALLFDALEYGHGDWGQSIRYMELLLLADPKNLEKSEALRRLRDFKSDGESRTRKSN
jgi:tetratricopeptide (TPR) repeat protein